MAELFHPPPAAPPADDRIARIEARLARIEAQLDLGFGLGASREPSSEPQRMDLVGDAPRAPSSASRADELEREMGQNGFAIAGIAALTIGVGYMLFLPHPGLPAALPGTLGIALAAALQFVLHRFGRRIGSLTIFAQGAAMILLFLAALRFNAFPTSSRAGVNAGPALLIGAVGLNAILAWRRGFSWLLLLSLFMGCVATLAIGNGGLLAISLPLLVAMAVFASRQRSWPAVELTSLPLVYATYFVWAIGNPIRTGRFQYIAEPAAGPVVVLAIIALYAAGSLLRPNRAGENGVTNASALMNCVLGYGCFLIHSAASFPRLFAALHATAFVLTMSIAVLFWIREHSRVSTFFYALTAYVALSMTIIKLAPMPEVFVWLSVQSVVVVATAIWFRSRLIVVANFAIYAAIVAGYVFLAQRETGISPGFGLVALISARILNWQQDRLELKTGLMRNAYLLGAFIVFPYALYHLVAAPYLALAWIGLAVVYYALNLVMRNQKYRWMGHATLGLAGIFLVLAGTGRLEAGMRVASFLALGIVLLVVSLTYARSRR